MSVDLSTKNILAKVTVHSFKFQEKDEERISELSSKYGVDPKLIDLKKTTMMKEFTKSIDSIISSVYPIFTDYTSPWRDGGWRILPTYLFSKFEDAIRRKNEELQEALNEFIPSYNSFIERTKLALGGMANNINYPTADYLRSRYSFSVSYDPLPTSGDFRLDISKDIADKIKQNCEENSNRAVKEAMDNIWNRVIASIEKIYERFSAEDFESVNKAGETIMRKPRLSESIIENLKDLIELLPGLNITNNPFLETVRQEMESKFASISIESIKEDDELRKTKAKEAETLLNNIKTLM
jgi:hypothetical protein